MVTILLIGYLNYVDLSLDDYQVLEFYAGKRRVAKLASALGFSSAAMDKLYDTTGDNVVTNNCMDINTSGGFLPLTCSSGNYLFVNVL